MGGVAAGSAAGAGAMSFLPILSSLLAVALSRWYHDHFSTSYVQTSASEDHLTVPEVPPLARGKLVQINTIM